MAGIHYACALALCALAPAQDLRRAVLDADLVLVGERIASDAATVRIRAIRVLHGKASAEALEVHLPARTEETEEEQLEAIPQRALYCLRRIKDRDDSYTLRDTALAELACDTEQDRAALVELTEILLAAEAGASPKATCDRLVPLALGPHPRVRIEATELLRERQSAADRLSVVHRRDLLDRATAETDDMGYKIALSRLCGERRIPGWLESLTVGIDQTDETFARALGRLAQAVHADEAAALLEKRIQEVQSPEEQGLLLVALGATRSERALRSLLRWRKVHGGGRWVDAALRAHGTQRAVEAVGKRPHKESAERRFD